VIRRSGPRPNLRAAGNRFRVAWPNAACDHLAMRRIPPVPVRLWDMQESPFRPPYEGVSRDPDHVTRTGQAEPCPNCGSRNVARAVGGRMLPEAYRSGEYMDVHYCMPTDEPMYSRHCNACGYMWWAGSSGDGTTRGAP